MPTENPYLLVVGIVLGIIFIGSAVYFANKLFVEKMEDSLIKIIILIVVAFAALYIVDKAILVNRHLLEPEQSKDLFNLVKDLAWLGLGKYLGNQGAKAKQTKTK